MVIIQWILLALSPVMLFVAFYFRKKLRYKSILIVVIALALPPVSLVLLRGPHYNSPKITEEFKARLLEDQQERMSHFESGDLVSIRRLVSYSEFYFDKRVTTHGNLVAVGDGYVINDVECGGVREVTVDVTSIPKENVILGKVQILGEILMAGESLTLKAQSMSKIDSLSEDDCK